MDQATFIPVPILPGVSLRRGRPQDLPSVTRLSRDVDFLSGGDYMPGTWLYMLNHPKWHVFVAEKDGEVVSTACVRSVRGGLQAAGVGGKTHPSVRQEGVFAAIKMFMVANSMAAMPHMQCFYGITPFIELHLNARETGSPMWNFKDVGRRHQWWMKPTIGDVASAINRLENMNITTISIKSITEPELKAVFRDTNLRKELFPGNHFQMTAEMYEAHEDVTDVVYTGFRKVFMGEESSSLSITATFPCPVGTAVHTDYFGTAELDVVLRHVLQGLVIAAEEHKKHGGLVFLLMGFPIPCDIKKLTNIGWKQLGLPEKDNKVQEVMMAVYNSQTRGIFAKL